MTGQTDTMEFNIHYHFPEFVCIETRGLASVDGFERLVSTLIQHPRWRTGSNLLLDHRKLEMKDVNYTEMLQIAAVVRSYRDHLGKGRCAFVIRDKLGLGLSRMYGLLGGDALHAAIAVFFQIDQARNWLRERYDVSDS